MVIPTGALYNFCRKNSYSMKEEQRIILELKDRSYIKGSNPFLISIVLAAEYIVKYYNLSHQL
jgi:hypothetical protein